jgi:tetratricopeptide (TPR) repeat protein
MRNYIFILCIVFVAFFAGCGGTRTDNSGANANTNAANAQPSVPQYPDARTAFDEGSKFFEDDKETLAIEALKQAVEMDPNMAEAHFKLGMAYSILEKEKDAEGAFEKAVDAYKKALKDNPKDAQAQFDLGRSYNKLNKDEDAEDALRAAVKLNPGDGSFNRELGALLVKIAKYSDAITFLKKALDIDPEDARAEELMEKAEDGKKRVESGIPMNSNRPAGNHSSSNSNSNSAADANNRPVSNTGTPPEVKKPETRPSAPKAMEPDKPAAKLPAKVAKKPN